MKVLYVEDNPANVFLVKRVARMGNHEIINYIDGNQALQKFDELAPDLVLMDIQLAGGKNGLDVVKELRARGVKTPIIAVTAYAMVGDKERCIAAGCDDYLAKPLPIPRLVDIFKKYADSLAKVDIDTTTVAPESDSPVKADATSSTVSKTEAATDALAKPTLSETTEAATVTTNTESTKKETNESQTSVEKADTTATSSTTDDTPVESATSASTQSTTQDTVTSSNT